MSYELLESGGQPNSFFGRSHSIQSNEAAKEHAKAKWQMLAKYTVGGIIIGVVVTAVIMVSSLLIHRAITHHDDHHNEEPLPLCRKAATAKLFTPSGLDTEGKEKDEVLVLWGGKRDADTYLNDYWHFNVDSHHWTAGSLNPAPPARWKFGEAIYENYLWIFAGDLDGHNYTNDLWKIDVETNKPTRVRAYDDSADNVTNPMKRRACNLAPLKGQNKLVMFGGRTMGKGEGLLFNDIWTYDIESDMWALLDAGETKPGPRKGASMVVQTENDGTWSAIVQGGRNDDEYFDDVWMYSSSRSEWKELEFDHTQPFPNGRNHHMNVLANGLVYVVFGRGGQDDTFFNDLWTFNLTTHKWTELTPTNKTPKKLWKRYLHSVELAKNGNDIVIFGGEGLPPDASDAKPSKLNDIFVYSIVDNEYRWLHDSHCPTAKKKKTRKHSGGHH